MISRVGQQWREALEDGCYERRVRDRQEFLKLEKLSRVWRYILGRIQLPPGASVFEVGCGGGNQLIPLALHGFKCVGIDCSEAVLSRFQLFLSDVEGFAGHRLNVELIQGDFLSYEGMTQYDLVFNVGVVEHFLDDHERAAFIENKLRLCKPGGYVVSMVPNGQHPLRDRMRKERLGGYCVPEIDYSPEMMELEMTKAGATDVTVIPYNLFGYLLMDSQRASLKRVMNQFTYLSAQILPRLKVPSFYRHAGTLICIARRGETT